VNLCRRPGDQGRTSVSHRVFTVTPLDLSSLIPYLWGTWVTGLIWVVIQLARGAWHDRLSFRSAIVTVRQGASCACAVSVCAIATAAYSRNLISHGVEGLIFFMLSAAMVGSSTACDRAGPDIEFSSGDSGSSDSGN
jgi:hypothetical protein